MQLEHEYEPMDIEISVPSKGIVLKEKAVIAVGKDGDVVAVGNQAAHTHFQKDEVELQSPLRWGEVADYEKAECLLTTLVKKATKDIDRPVRMRMGLLLPANAKPEQQRYYQDMLKTAGAKEVLLLPANVSEDELEREEEKCKVIVSIKKEVGMEQ